MDQILIEIHSLTDPGVFSRDSQSAMLTDLLYIFLIALAPKVYTPNTHREQLVGNQNSRNSSNISGSRAGFGFFSLRSASTSKGNVI